MAKTPQDNTDAHAAVFGGSQKLRDWRSIPVAPTRNSGLATVVGAPSEKARRRDFYLKIDGLTGPRKKVPAKPAGE